VPLEPGEPSNRWPWVALALGLLVIAVAVAFFLINRQRTVNVNVPGSSTPNAVAAAGTGSPGPPPTLVPPTLPPSATFAPTATPAPSPTAVPSPTTPPASPTPVPAAAAPPTAQTAPPAQPTPPPGQATQPAQPAQPAAPSATVPPTSAPAPPTSPPAPPTSPPTAAAPTTAPGATAPGPAAFTGQVAGAGGYGNTRADLDAAYGPPAGETPEHLVVYRKSTFEYHVAFVPDPNGRAAVLVGISQPPSGQAAQPFTLEQALAEAHRLMPRDALPPNPQQEGNPQFVVERVTSQTLAQALPAEVFTANKGQPGQFMVVYVRDPAQSTRIARFIIGPGTDPNALINQGR
jgi:hypothetical protein